MVRQKYKIILCAFTLWLRMLNVSSCIFLVIFSSFGNYLFISFVPLSIESFFLCLVFLVLYIYWILMPCLMNSRQVFSLILAIFSFDGH
jgi:hypothetical protein